MYEDYYMTAEDVAEALKISKSFAYKVIRDMNREIIYNLNGIYQPHNLSVTAEGPNNEFDMEAVRRMVNGVLLPMMAI